MSPKPDHLPDDVRKLQPLTPAVFFILFSLAQGEKHGYAIMQEIDVLSGGKFSMGPGTLYSTIKRLLDMSLIKESDAESGGRRRLYRLTRNGRLLFTCEVSRMDALVKLVHCHNTLLQEGA